MILKLQKLRAGTKDQSYRIALPKALIEAHNLQDSEFKIEIKNNTIILLPVK